MPATLPVLVGMLFIGTPSFFGIRAGSVEPPFAIVGRVGEVEIRQYGPRMVVEVHVAGAEDAARASAVERLTGFVSGANLRGAEVAATLPFAQRREGGGGEPSPGEARLWAVSVHLPLRATAATVPSPNDSALRVRTLPAKTVAVLRFTGVPRPAKTAERRAALAAVLASSGWRSAGAAELWFYDPPWTVPVLRRNEIVVPVAPRDPG